MMCAANVAVDKHCNLRLANCNLTLAKEILSFQGSRVYYAILLKSYRIERYKTVIKISDIKLLPSCFL